MRVKPIDLLPKNSKQRAEHARSKKAKVRPEDELVYEEGITASGHGPIPEEIKKAVIVDKAKGLGNKLIASKYEVSVGSVAKIWKEFAGTIGTAISDEDDSIRFKSRIRKKAVDAIESGLDCNNNPYQQAGIGIKVMEGIGEFKGDKTTPDIKFNVFMSGVPAEWRDRYLGIEQTRLPEDELPRGRTIGEIEAANDREGDR